jgi:hypothetical protein
MEMRPRGREGVVKLLLGLDKNFTDRRRRLEGDKTGTKLLLLLLLPPSVSCSCGGGETLSKGMLVDIQMQEKTMKTKAEGTTYCGCHDCLLLLLCLLLLGA